MGVGDSTPAMAPVAATPVRLAVSPFGPKVPGMPQAHHTSVSIGNLEYSFGPLGITRSPPFQSHACFSGPLQVTDVGKTDLSGDWLLKTLSQHFKDGTYDLLRKNCNSFSDCALFFLLGKRLDEKYRALEEIGVGAEQMGVVRMLSLGEYKPNPKVDNFRVNTVLELARRGRKAASRLEGSSESPRKASKKVDIPSRNSSYYVGQNVQVRSKSFEGWVNAVIMRKTSDGGVTVRYENGQFQKDVPQNLMSQHIRPME